MVIKIKPKPTWKKPAKKPKKISCEEIINLFDSRNPIKHELIPATNCAGTISTVGNFLTIIISTANVIGIVNAAKLPDSSPGESEFPTIKKTPEIAKTIALRDFTSRVVNAAKELEGNPEFNGLSVGFSDDDLKNVELAKEFIGKELKNSYPNVRFLVYDTSDPKNTNKKRIVIQKS